MILDYSAYREWSFCPASWYEKYINKRTLRWPARQRDDALCLGSMVHEGLEVWQKEHIVLVPQPVVDRLGPTPECLALAYELIMGYSRAYPEERWELIVCEEPLRFELLAGESKSPHHPDRLIGGLEGLAKIDSYFYTPEPYIVESGVPGLQFTLSEGWWIHEYKTKGPDVSLPLFMQKWDMNLQASFQVLALQEKLRQAGEGGVVQGVLVNVLEKPKRYIPKRKCPVCNEQYEYATWLPTGDGEFACPICGSRKKLEPLKQDPVQHNANYYRIVVSRTQEQLEHDQRDMVCIGQRMQEMEVGGLESEPWQKENCTKYKRACDYFSNHLNNLTTIEDGRMQDAEKYRGIEEDV